MVRNVCQRAVWLLIYTNETIAFEVECATEADLEAAHTCTRPSAVRFLEKYEQWSREYGSHL